MTRQSEPAYSAAGSARTGPLICFSHLRWDFVFQRPQHLMTRFARHRPVIFFEEPKVGEGGEAHLARSVCADSGVIVATPMLPAALQEDAAAAVQERMLQALLAEYEGLPILWYYTPMMLAFSSQVEAAAIVYDCMDELTGFRFAPPQLQQKERELMARADVVFTGGVSLWEAKKNLHPNVHAFPSSVDKAHFAAARSPQIQPSDQIHLPGPRLGYYGVIDERLDLQLIARLADARPQWSIVLVGPVVKVDPAELPRRSNIHYLGPKTYDALPSYLAGWSVALAPFALNEATRFISPTKTPEYLAGGRPVVSTPIADVVRTYGALQGVGIAEGSTAFIEACDEALRIAPLDSWRSEADALLADLSWDRTFARMAALVDAAASGRGASLRVAGPSLVRTSERKRYDYLIVGAGFAGAVMAERLAADAGASVLVIDKRPHIGGNAYDHQDEAGVLVHRYGPHIFHTNSRDIFSYLSRFTKWRHYEHRVLAAVDEKLVPIPINRTTLNTLYDLDLQDEAQTAAYLASRAEPVEDVRTSEDVVVSAVGRELYETFFKGYTRKQWGLDPSQLDRSVTARVPTRCDTDDRYFTDSFQFMPLDGYTAMFEAMLDHPLIEVRLETTYDEIKGASLADHVIYCGPIDEFFDYRFGKLPYRSLRFENRTYDREQAQPVAVINYPDPATPHTRITEYKHLTGQQHPRTSVTIEHPSAEGDPYYPIPRPENQALYKRYEALAARTEGVTFLGRLGTYRYYNMDQVVGQALATYRRLNASRAGETIGPDGTVARA